MVYPELVLLSFESMLWRKCKKRKNTSYQHFCFTCSPQTKLMKWLLLKLELFCRRQWSCRRLVLDTTPYLWKWGEKIIKIKLQASVNDLTSSRCFRRDETSADVGMNFASFLGEWVCEYCMVAFLGEEGDYRCLSRQKGKLGCLKGPLFPAQTAHWFIFEPVYTSICLPADNVGQRKPVPHVAVSRLRLSACQSAPLRPTVAVCNASY